MSLYTLEAVEPFFAPLSAPMIAKAASFQEEDSGSFPPLNLRDAVSAFEAKYARLRQRFVEPRKETFNQMQPAIRDHHFTTDWMLSTLTRYTPNRDAESPLTDAALYKWRGS